jgi:hypothetical protein
MEIFTDQARQRRSPCILLSTTALMINPTTLEAVLFNKTRQGGQILRNF